MQTAPQIFSPQSGINTAEWRWNVWKDCSENWNTAPVFRLWEQSVPLDLLRCFCSFSGNHQWFILLIGLDWTFLVWIPWRPEAFLFSSGSDRVLWPLPTVHRRAFGPEHTWLIEIVPRCEREWWFFFLCCPSMSWKLFQCLALRDCSVGRHRSGEDFRNIPALGNLQSRKCVSALKVPKSSVTSIILERKKSGTTKSWAVWACWGIWRKTLVKEQEPNDPVCLLSAEDTFKPIWRLWGTRVSGLRSLNTAVSPLFLLVVSFELNSQASLKCVSALSGMCSWDDERIFELSVKKVKVCETPEGSVATPGLDIRPLTRPDVCLESVTSVSSHPSERWTWGSVVVFALFQMVLPMAVTVKSWGWRKLRRLECFTSGSCLTRPLRQKSSPWACLLAKSPISWLWRERTRWKTQDSNQNSASCLHHSLLHCRCAPRRLGRKQWEVHACSAVTVALFLQPAQAFLEMGTEEAAITMVNYYATVTPHVRNIPVFIQYSNHKELKTDAGNQVCAGWPFISVVGGLELAVYKKKKKPETLRAA